MKFLIVEDNIVKNVVVGTIDLADPTWINLDYNADIGWKYVEQFDVFMRPDWTTETWQEYVTAQTNILNELQAYYTSLVASTHHMETFDEEKQNEIREYLSSINDRISNIEKHVSNIYNSSDVHLEPLEVRPNLESEV